MDDLNKLNKNQIVLLTLLISFVTSIATGIVTVSLIQQAPQSVVGPVNQVVLKTVERVVSDGKPQTIIKEVPVIVTEEQLIVKVITGARGSIVDIFATKIDLVATSTIVSSGFVASADGLIIASGDAGLKPNQNYEVRFSDGKRVSATVVSAEGAPLAVLRLVAVSAPLVPLQLVAEDVAVGQTVVALGSTNGDTAAVAVGIISGVNKVEGQDTKLRTSAANIDNIGSPLLGVSGKVVGISQGAGVALTQAAIKASLDSVKK